MSISVYWGMISSKIFLSTVQSPYYSQEATSSFKLSYPSLWNPNTIPYNFQPSSLALFLHQSSPVTSKYLSFEIKSQLIEPLLFLNTSSKSYHSCRPKPLIDQPKIWKSSIPNMYTLHLKFLTKCVLNMTVTKLKEAASVRYRYHFTEPLQRLRQKSIFP